MLRTDFALAIFCLPTLAALLGTIGPQWLKRQIPLITSSALCLAWGCAVLTLVTTLRLGTLDIVLLTWQQIPLLGILIDRLSAVMLVFVTTISAIIHLYARRAMHGEPQRAQFFVLLTSVTVAVLGVLLANSLVMLCVFWALKGALLSRLIGHAPERRAARLAARHKLLVDLIGDSAFILALWVASSIFGTLRISAMNAMAASAHTQQHLVEVTAVTLLLLIAVLVKSAQLPFGSWLPASLEAPTPVSALMHAGLVNAGGFLVVRLSPLFQVTPVTSSIAVLIGALTALYGTSVMLTRPDVKNELAYSTMGQMGFMILECGLGAYAVAIVHLIAHGLFKATLFLSSGDVIRQHRISTYLRSEQGDFVPVYAVWGLQMVGLVVVGIFIVMQHASLGSLLFLFAWLTFTVAFRQLRTTDKSTTILLFGGIVLVGAGYVGLLKEAEAFFAPVVGRPLPASLLSVFLAVAVLGGVSSVTALAQSIHRPLWFERMQDWLYVLALQRGYLTKDLLFSLPLPRRSR